MKLTIIFIRALAQFQMLFKNIKKMAFEWNILTNYFTLARLGFRP